MTRTQAFTLIAASVLAVGLAGSPAAGQMSPTMNPSNAPAGAMRSAQYATQAALTDRFEIEAARLALEKSRTDGVRRFAQHMIDEHQRMSAQLKTAATGQVAVPVDQMPLDPYHMQKLSQLRMASGAEFDRMYIDAQVMGHREAIDLHQDYARDGSNPPLKQVATQAVPHVQQHLNQALSLQRQVATVPAAPYDANEEPRQGQRQGVARPPMNMPQQQRQQLPDNRSN